MMCFDEDEPRKRSFEQQPYRAEWTAVDGLFSRGSSVDLYLYQSSSGHGAALLVGRRRMVGEETGRNHGHSGRKEQADDDRRVTGDSILDRGTSRWRRRIAL